MIMAAFGDNPALIGRYLSTSNFHPATFHLRDAIFPFLFSFFDLNSIFMLIQSGASSLAKHGGAYFSAVYGSIQDPIAAPGLFDIQVP